MNYTEIAQSVFFSPVDIRDLAHDLFMRNINPSDEAFSDEWNRLRRIYFHTHTMNWIDNRAQLSVFFDGRAYQRKQSPIYWWEYQQHGNSWSGGPCSSEHQAVYNGTVVFGLNELYSSENAQCVAGMLIELKAASVPVELHSGVSLVPLLEAWAAAAKLAENETNATTWQQYLEGNDDTGS